MNSLGGRHPDDESLLRSADGELPADEAVEVQSHLKACWQCRARLESLERVVRECVRYYQTGFAPNAPPPPQEWVDMRRQLADVERTLSQPSFYARVWTALLAVRRFRKPALSMALSAAVVAIVFFQLYRTPSARAAELLHRAVKAATERQARPHRIEIRSRGRHISRLVGGVSATREQPANGNGLSAEDQKEFDHLQSLFASANYSWAEPLSAKAFSSWRETLRGKRDEVTVQEQPQAPDVHFYRVRTTTDSSSLAEATILLRARDLRPIEGSWRFRDAEYVEMSEVPLDHAGEGTTGAPAAQAQGPAEDPAPSRPTATQRSVGTADELRVMAALRKVGADLGEPVEVTRTTDEVLVTGMGIEPERQRQIQTALGTLPQVVTRFSEGKPPSVPPSQEPTANIAATASTEQARSWLEGQLGSRSSAESFAERVLGLTDAITARAHALRRLAERFPSEAEGQLSPEERQILIDLRADHESALNLNARELRKLIGQALKNLSSSGSGLSAAGPRLSTWQAAAEQSLARAQEVDKLAAGLIAGIPTGVPPSFIPARLCLRLAEIEVLSSSFAAVGGNGQRGRRQ